MSKDEERLRAQQPYVGQGADDFTADVLREERNKTCRHCGRPIQDDDGTWFHPDTMSARCDGPDDEPGIAWGDLVRQAEPED